MISAAAVVLPSPGPSLLPSSCWRLQVRAVLSAAFRLLPVLSLFSAVAVLGCFTLLFGSGFLLVFSGGIRLLQLPSVCSLLPHSSTAEVTAAPCRLTRCSLTVPGQPELSFWRERGLNASKALESHKLTSRLHLAPRQQPNVSAEVFVSPGQMSEESLLCVMQLRAVSVKLCLAEQAAWTLPQLVWGQSVLLIACPALRSQ